MERVCKTCRVSQSTECFHKHGERLLLHCKSCGLAAARERYKRRGYRLRFKERNATRFAKWKEKNKEHYLEYQRNYHAERADSPTERIRQRWKTRIRTALKSGRASLATEHVLGCRYDHFRGYIEAQFSEGMSWGNFHLIHIDHKIPIGAFDLLDEQSFMQCYNYSNLQPLWARDNLSKGDTLPGTTALARHKHFAK